jgi:hypothetical protein
MNIEVKNSKAEKFAKAESEQRANYFWAIEKTNIDEFLVHVFCLHVCVFFTVVNFKKIFKNLIGDNKYINIIT